MARTAETVAQEPAVETSTSPAAKKIKLSDQNESGSGNNRLEVAANSPAGFSACQRLLFATDKPTAALPECLQEGGKVRNDLNLLKKLFEVNGFRTSVISSPRSGLSIYKDSCRLEGNESSASGKHFLLTMIGLHPHQVDMEHWYATSIKKIYCLILFCNRIRALCPEAVDVESVKEMLEANERLCRTLSPSKDNSNKTPSLTVDAAHVLAASVPERVSLLSYAVVDADPRLRIEQFQHEYDRLTLWNSTLTNATLQLFLDGHSCCIQNVYFKRSHVPKYERITVYLYDPTVDMVKPPRFTFLPSLHRALEDGPEMVVQDMIESFWKHLLRRGYFATNKIKTEVTPDLEDFFFSGLAADPNIPLLLKSHFTPQYPLSFYLYGKAGAGKSSLVRHFSPTINAAIEEHVDPELLVRFVKQNLNKPMSDLELELELRPNNNDLSVMSIIQGRRMTMTQTKPGLVVVDLEEMASNNLNANPNQLKTSQLLSQRFSGRNSNYKEGSAAAPRNSTKRGISGDASLIVLFTSNYELEKPCKEALQRLEMFANIKIIEMTAVSGDDRLEFAHSYINRCVQDRFADLSPACDVELIIPFGGGDTRPLVRHLRMLAFYVCALVADTVSVGSSVTAKVVQNNFSHLCAVSTANRSIELRVGTLNNLFPVTHQVFDSRTEKAMEEIRKASRSSADVLDEMSQIVDFWFAKTLAPAVVVSQDAALISTLVKAVSKQREVHSIQGVEAGSYKMTRSLYDPNDTPNLRDDILKFGKGVFVAVELLCRNKDSQLCIREIIEDSPSMTAFSTNKSALFKDGLIFFVYIAGDITPEVRSRASFIL